VGGLANIIRFTVRIIRFCHFCGPSVKAASTLAERDDVSLAHMNRPT
jgi:hypothetical protein